LLGRRQSRRRLFGEGAEGRGDPHAERDEIKPEV